MIVARMKIRVQEERGQLRRQALAAAAKDAKLSQVKRSMQALEARLIQALQSDKDRCPTRLLLPLLLLQLHPCTRLLLCAGNACCCCLQSRHPG